jgi:lysylphosphatidylglycerol synthetase-like protein (DUF2156 family)
MGKSLALAALACILVSGFAQAVNESLEGTIKEIKTEIKEPLIFGVLTRDQLIVIIVAIVALYVVARLLMWLYSKDRQKRQAETSAVDRVAQLRGERDKLKGMMDSAKKSFYKRELSEGEANKLMFEYKQKIMDIEAELKRLGGA